MTMKKQMLTMLSVFLLGSSIAGGSVFAGETVKATQLTVAEPIVCEIEGNYFEDMKEYIDKEVKKENKADALKLLTEAEKLEKAEKFDEASKVWEKFDKLLPELETEIDIDFDFYGEIKDQINKEVKAEDKKEALKLLDELEKLEKAEDFEKADKVWEKLVKIIPGYDNSICEFDGDVDAGDIDDGDYFEDMKDYINKEVKAENKKEALKLLSEIEKLEKAEKFEDADKVWDQLEKVLPEFDEGIDIGEISDADFYKEVKSMIEKEAKDSSTKEKALKMLSEIENLEKDEKYDDAEKIWEALDKLVPFAGEEIK